MENVSILFGFELFTDKRIVILSCGFLTSGTYVRVTRRIDFIFDFEMLRVTHRIDYRLFWFRVEHRQTDRHIDFTFDFGLRVCV